MIRDKGLRDTVPQKYFFTEWFLLVFLLTNALLPIYGVTILSALYLIYYVISSNFTVPRDMMKYLIIPATLITLGLAGSRENLIYDALKDGWYFLNPVLIFSTGYLITRKIQQLDRVVKFLVLTGFILGVYHILTVLSSPKAFFELSVKDFHEEKGRGYFLTMVSFCLLLFSRRHDIQIFKSYYGNTIFYLIMTINTLSIILSLSRTLWVSFLILITVGSGWLSVRKLKVIMVIVFIVFLLQFLILSSPEIKQDRSKIIGKIAHSLEEIMVSDYTTKGDIQSHWRGYETYMAIKTYQSGDMINYFIGHGFGKLIDLKINMRLGENQIFRYIPVTHNGYVYVLVKTGMIGLILYILYLITFIRSGSRYVRIPDNHVLFSGKFIIATSLSLLFTTLVAAGIFNKSSQVPFILLLGSLLSYAKLRINRIHYSNAFPR